MLDRQDDDDEDPFFMPLPSALKLADASKFSMLAIPISKEEPSPFMIAMEPGEGGHPHDRTNLKGCGWAVHTVSGGLNRPRVPGRSLPSKSLGLAMQCNGRD